MDKDRLLQELAQQKQELKSVEKELREKNREFQILKNRKKKLDEIKPQLAAYRMKKEDLSLKEAKNKIASLWALMIFMEELGPLPPLALNFSKKPRL